MTPEEIERAFEIVLNNQANFEVQLEKTNRQVEETSIQLGETNRRVEETNRNVQELSRQVEETNRNVQELSRQVEETNRNVQELSRQVEVTSRNVQELSRNVQETSRQVEDTNKRLELFADTQTEFIQVVTRHIEAQGKFNNSIHNAVRDLSSTVERYISEGRNGKA